MIHPDDVLEELRRYREPGTELLLGFFAIGAVFLVSQGELVGAGLGAAAAVWIVHRIYRGEQRWRAEQ